MNAKKLFTLFFIIFNTIIQTAIPAQRAFSNEGIPLDSPQCERTIDHKLSDVEFVVDEEKIPFQQEQAASAQPIVKNIGYKRYEIPHFAKHLSVMTKKADTITMSDVEAALDEISENDLAEVFPALAECTQHAIKPLLYHILSAYVVCRVEWCCSAAQKPVTTHLYWCSPCADKLEEAHRFLLILHQLNDIVQAYPEYQNNLDQSLVLTEFGEDGCLQPFLLIIGLLSINYCNLIFNLLGVADSDLYDKTKIMSSELLKLEIKKPRKITINGYTQKKYWSFSLDEEKLLGHDISESRYNSLSKSFYQQTGIKVPQHFRNYEHISFWVQLIIEKVAQRSHCISITDPGLIGECDFGERVQLMADMLEQFCEIARYGAQDPERALIYGLKKKLCKYDSMHHDFFHNIWLSLFS